MTKDFNAMKPWGMMARCIVNPDHTVAYFLHPSNSNLKADGTEVDWEEVEELGQNCMVQIPKFYFVKKWDEEQQAWYFGVTDEPVDTDVIGADEWKLHYAFFRDRTKLCDDESANPIEVDYRYYGAFKGWKDAKGRLRSLPNKEPVANISRATTRTCAKDMGLGWTQLDYYLLYAVQMLYITEFGHPDGRTMIGKGYLTGSSGPINTGGTLAKGNNTFGGTTDKVQMSYRGIEDWWGNLYEFVEGLYIDTNYYLYIVNKGFKNDLSSYKSLVRCGYASGNIKQIQPIGKAGFFIKSNGGDYYSGGLYSYGTLSTNCGGVFGACYDSSEQYGGAFGFRVINASSSKKYGTRLVL